MLGVVPGDVVELDAPGDDRLGSPEQLAWFIQTGIEQFPAERYAVLLSDHGGGWVGVGPDWDGFPDSYDGLDDDDMLQLAEIDLAFATALEMTGVDKIDLVGFDACLMGSYALATTMSEHARFLLASEELEPGLGWDYVALESLRENPDQSAVELGELMIDGYAEQTAAAGQGASITLSLLDLSAMGELDAALGGLGEQLMAQPAATAPFLARAELGAVQYGRSPDQGRDADHVDLGGLVAGLAAENPAFEDLADEVMSALDSVVVDRTTGPVTADSTGLSVYFPPDREAYMAGDEMSGQHYADIFGFSVWPAVLESYYTAGESITRSAQPMFLESGGLADYSFEEGGLYISGTFDLAAQGNLVQAEIFYGVLDESDDSIVFIGEEPGWISTDGSGLADAFYDLTILTISDGVDTGYAYLDLTVDEENGLFVIDVPLDYIPPEEFEEDDPLLEAQAVVLSLVLDEEGTIVGESYYQVNDEGTYGALTADPDGVIHPILLNEYPDGEVEWIDTTEFGLSADLPSLEYSLEPLEPGTGLYAELVITDYGGNEAWVSMFDYLP